MDERIDERFNETDNNPSNTKKSKKMEKTTRNIPKDYFLNGVYYSFALYPEEYQPSGYSGRYARPRQ